MDTKEKIILAAVEEFATRGYRAATIRNICRRAAVNIAAVNYHFAGKAELYRQALAKLFADKPPLPAADGIKSQADLKATLRKWIWSFMTRSNDWKIRKNRIREKVAYHEMLEPSAIFDEIFDTYLKPDVISLEEILRKGLPDDVAEKEIMLRTFTVLGSCMFYFFNYRMVEKIWLKGDFLSDNMNEAVDLITEQNMADLKYRR